VVFAKLYNRSHAVDFQRTLWRLLQKRVVRTKFDFYGFIGKFKTTSRRSDVCNHLIRLMILCFYWRIF